MRARRLDELTAREQEVLQLVRAGLTNEEIAERLGVSLDGAKYHVSQILAKLGVSSREEAARIALAEQRPWWTRALKWSVAVKAAGVVVLAAAAVAIGVLAWSVLRNEEAASELASDEQAGPHIRDHWHATLKILIGDGELPPAAWLGQSGLGHGPDWVDGILHIIPQTAAQEGEGSSLGRLFERAGGALSEDELRLPGGETYRTDDPVPGEGSPGQLTVLKLSPYCPAIANSTQVVPDYIPRDGDRIIITFAQGTPGRVDSPCPLGVTGPAPTP